MYPDGKYKIQDIRSDEETNIRSPGPVFIFLTAEDNPPQEKEKGKRKKLGCVAIIVYMR